MPEMPVCYQGMILAYRTFTSFTLTGVNMYVVFLLNKKHCIGYTIHVWCLIPVTYVSGKLHLCRYVAWCTKYSVIGKRKAVYTYISSPPPPLWRGVEGLYPVCDLAYGVLQCLMKFT